MTTEQTLKLMVETLTKVNEQQARVNEMQGRQISELTQQVRELTAQIAWFQRQMFGRKSEKHISIDNTPNLFDSAGIELDVAETNPEEPQPEPVMETVTRKSQKGKKRPRQTWDNLPVLERRIIEPRGVDLTGYRRIGEEVTTLVGFEPGKYYRIEVIRPKYGLIDPTEPVEKGKGVLIAPLPKFPIYKGVPDASLLTEILLQKYEYHAPFYRQIKQMAHMGMTGVKEATMVGWYRRTMELLRPLYNLLVAEVFRSDYVQADESTVPVINNDTHQADKEYLWMSRAVMERLVVFFYDEGSRAGSVIKDKTDKYSFKGYIQCDGFGGYISAYRSSADVRLVGCMVHIRRHWEAALDENRNAASWFLGKIRELYHIEHECDALGMDSKARKAERQKRSKPIMEGMRGWMENEGLRYSERTLTGKAVTYAYTRWENMMRVLDDGRLKLDNNLAENEIRPITLGRKNYLFCGNHEAAENMCVIQSLLATCRNHDINPRLYLNSVIASMPYFEKATEDELRALLPHKWKEYHPEAIMTTPVRQLAK